MASSAEHAPPAPSGAPSARPATATRSFEELGTPLADVTFVVVDLETTGASADACAITEVGALKLRGGECLGTFETLVNPGVPIPPMITVLTGITEAMVMPAPTMREVLPAFIEWLGPPCTTVVVGHNVRFDISFLDAALAAGGYPRLSHQRVDTLALARRLLRDEVPNLKLSTLARHLRVPTEPAHRAFADASATAEVLHALLERAGSLGVLGLDDLLELPTIRAHPSVSKLRLTARLPRTPGVYLFRDRGGRVLYVGKASNLRSRVRSYFSGDQRRKVPQLLRETESIDYVVCAHPLEAAVREIRLIHTHQPRFNRRAKAWRSYAYLKLTLGERFPRLAVVREMRDDGGHYVGPFYSSSAAHAAREAIESAIPLRRCTTRVARTTAIVPTTPCMAAQLGVAACPCRGYTSDHEYEAIIEVAERGLRCDPYALLDPLEARMHAMARAERFEEAAFGRDRLAALSRTVQRHRQFERLRAAGRVVLDGPTGCVEIVDGRLVLDDDPLGLDRLAGPVWLDGRPPPRELFDELLVVARWLEREATDLRLRAVEGPLASPLPALTRYEPPRRVGSRPSR